jgi:hypothetical protein
MMLEDLQEAAKLSSNLGLTAAVWVRTDEILTQVDVGDLGRLIIAAMFSADYLGVGIYPQD